MQDGGVIQYSGDPCEIRPVVPPLWRLVIPGRHRGGTTGRLYEFNQDLEGTDLYSRTLAERP